jgi:hypothetical protein
LPVGIRRRLPSSSRWLSSLARQRPPSPAVVIAAATIDGGAWIFFCDVFILPRACTTG